MRGARRRRRELEARDLPSGGRETAGERSLAGETTRLQELIGNTNVTELIARSALQRDETATEAAPAKSGEEEEKGDSYVMTMSEIGTFDLLSFSWGASSSSGSESGTTKDKKHHEDLYASRKGGDESSAKIMERASDGRHIASVELLLKRDGKTVMTITLKDVAVTGFQMGGASGEAAPTETFSLMYAEIEYKLAEDAKK